MRERENERERKRERKREKDRERVSERGREIIGERSVGRVWGEYQDGHCPFSIPNLCPCPPVASLGPGKEAQASSSHFYEVVVE